MGVDGIDGDVDDNGDNDDDGDNGVENDNAGDVGEFALIVFISQGDIFGASTFIVSRAVLTCDFNLSAYFEDLVGVGFITYGFPIPFRFSISFFIYIASFGIVPVRLSCKSVDLLLLGGDDDFNS